MRPFEIAPRYLFIPDVIWTERPDASGWRSLSRRDEPAAWWAAVDNDGYIVTQVDDGRPAEPGEYSAGPATQPSLVLRMLDALQVEDGHTVLEIGTGTGWNAALLSARLGDRAVITIEVDERLAATARASLAGAGFHPTVIAGDGAAGYAPGAPYDRIISTASVQRIPAAWINQTRPGGRILTPYGTPYDNNALVALTVADDGTATGRFAIRAAFTWMHGEGVLVGALRDYVHRGDHPDKSTTDLDPRQGFGHPDADFAIGLHVPGCSRHRFASPDDAEEFTIWLLDVTGGDRCWASVAFEPGTAHTVEQYGPRRLWDEIESAYRWWQEAGRPEPSRFGLTVGPDGEQAWLDSPDNPLRQGP